MKHIFKYIGALCSLCLLSVLGVSCSEDDGNGSTNVGLGIKVFFPTKVVTNQPMTINGSGFNNATEIEFPGGHKVSNFEIVSDDMIRVDAPSGIPAEGGKITVRTADDEAESRLSLTLGHTVVTGFSKQAGETATGGDLITVFGTDLEFINCVELLDANGEPQLIDHKDFYRKGTNNLIFRVPQTNIYKGTFVGVLHTYDGQSINMPELAYEPGASGGHWEKVKTSIWKNETGKGTVNWGDVNYRFSSVEGSTGEEDYAIPMDTWETMKTGSFFISFTFDADWYQIRVTNGWWDAQWQGNENDFTPNNMADRIIDNGDGTYSLEVHFGDDPIVNTLDQKHLLFTGGGYTPVEIYFEEDIWVDGGGHSEIVKTSFWKNDTGKGSVNWGDINYRFSSVEGSTTEEDYAIPMDTWESLKTGSFYISFTIDADWYQIRVTNGWWDTQWQGNENDFTPNNMADRIIDNGDGTYSLEINFGDDPIVGTLDQKHLLFTGSGYTPLELYFQEEVWVDGGGDTKKPISIWEHNGAKGSVDWGNTNYRFSSVEGSTTEEDYAIPMDTWDVIKNGTFYLQFKADADWYQIRVTNGWWDTQWLGSENDFSPGNMADKIIDNGDGTYYLEIHFGDDPIVGTLDQKHLLFTGSGYTPLKLYYYE